MFVISNINVNFILTNNYTIISLTYRIKIIYLNPIAACQTNANNKKNTGITGNTSTIGLKITYASGKRDNNKVSINNNNIFRYKFFKVYSINFSIKPMKFLTYINVLILTFFYI